MGVILNNLDGFWEMQNMLYVRGTIPTIISKEFFCHCKGKFSSNL
jgi:hypothetical protein